MLSSFSAIVLGLGIQGCDFGAKQTAVVAPENWEDAEVRGYRPVIDVILEPVLSRGRYEWPQEIAGLVSSLMEAYLTDIPGVLVRYNGGQPAPGLRQALRAGAGRWRLTPEIHHDGAQMRLTVRICPEPGMCEGVSATSPARSPHSAVTDIVLKAAEMFQRTPPPDIEAIWRKPVSKDDYAALLCGRAAAVVYGLKKAPANHIVGSRLYDPIIRAVFVDPTMWLAQWLLARRSLASGDFATAAAALDRAFTEGGSALVLHLAMARVHALSEDWELARKRWDAIALPWPNDARFVASHLDSYVQSGMADTAERLALQLPEPFQVEAPLAALLVRAAEAIGPAEDYEQRLLTWEKASPLNPEPLRKRIALAVRKHEFEEAAELLPSLEARGAVLEARALSVALRAELGDFAKAAEDARTLGETQLARGLALRARLAYDEEGVRAELQRSRRGDDALIRGALLLNESPKDALSIAERVLRSDRWRPEALVLRVAALEKLGRERELADAREKLYFVDPWNTRGPSIAAGSTGTGSQPQEVSP